MELVLDFQASRPATASASGTDTQAPPPSRPIRKHKKSRGACSNCRLRRVKCDEAKPECGKCQAYGVLCNYDRTKKNIDLEVKAQGVLQVEKLVPPPCSEAQTILSIINDPSHRAASTLSSSSTSSSDSICSYLDPVQQFAIEDLELLRKWKSRTMPTLGAGERMQIYDNAYTKLTFSHPFLFHVVLTVTLMHDRLSSAEPDHTMERTIAYHWGEGASLLNRRLRDGPAPSERDALWACAGMLGCLAFATFNAKTPAEAWPLKFSADDLNWLKMCQGKKAIWKLADPLRSDSVFSPLAPDFTKMTSAPSLHHILNVQDGQETDVYRLIKLCGIDDSSTQENNPYFGGVSVLAHLRTTNCNSATISHFLSFFGCTDQRLRSLLEQKDPCAMLLLAFWYAKVSKFKQWWLWPRANTELQAICMYLIWHHAHDDKIVRLVQDVKVLFDAT